VSTEQNPKTEGRLFPQVIRFSALLAVAVLSVPTLGASAQTTTTSVTPYLVATMSVFFPNREPVATSSQPFARGKSPVVLGDKWSAVIDHLRTTESMCIFANPGQTVGVGYGWRVELQPIGEDRGSLVVHVDWKRVRDQGRDVTTPNGSVELSLRMGQSLPLDYIVPVARTSGPGPKCEALGALLEVGLGGFTGGRF
jgi:hypothetical protein